MISPESYYYYYYDYYYYYYYYQGAKEFQGLEGVFLSFYCPPTLENATRYDYKSCELHY